MFLLRVAVSDIVFRCPQTKRPVPTAPDDRDGCSRNPANVGVPLRCRLLCLDELANAEADFDKALKLAPGDAYAQSGRAEVYQRQNKPVPEERSTGLSFDNLRRMMEQPSEDAAKKDHP